MILFIKIFEEYLLVLLDFNEVLFIRKKDYKRGLN